MLSFHYVTREGDAVTTSDWLTATLWVIGVLGTIMAGLLAILAYFLKRLIEQLDSNRRAVHDLRGELQHMHLRFRLFRQQVRMLLFRLGVKSHELEDDDRGDDDEALIRFQQRLDDEESRSAS